MTFEWINFDYSNPRFKEPSIPISGGGIPIYGTDDLEVLTYGWCGSVPSAEYVDITSDTNGASIEFRNGPRKEIHRTSAVEGIRLDACSDLAEYWTVNIQDENTPVRVYNFDGSSGDDTLQLTGFLDAFDGIDINTGAEIIWSYYQGDGGHDVLKIDGDKNDFSLREDVMGGVQYHSETGDPYFRHEISSKRGRFNLNLMDIEEIIFNDGVMMLPVPGGSISQNGLPAVSEESAVESPSPPVQNITNVVNNTNNITTTNISNSGSGNITVGNIGTVNNTTTIDNSFTIQTTNINLSLAITGDSKKSEKVEGTDGDDLIADGRGKDKLIGGDGADQFYFAGEEPFKKKTVDKIIDFDPSEGDAIVIADEVVGDLTEDPTLAIADTKKDLKQLSKDGYDLLYFEPKGDLYVDGNGDSKGFGKKSEGGMIADLPNDTILSESDVLIGI